MKFEKCSFNNICNIHVNCDELRLTLEGVEIAKEEELPTVSPFHCTISLHPDTPPQGLEELTPPPSFHKLSISPQPNSFPPNSRYKEQIYKNTKNGILYNLTFSSLSASSSCNGKSA